jgi:hypothetical protein
MLSSLINPQENKTKGELENWVHEFINQQQFHDQSFRAWLKQMPYIEKSPIPPPFETCKRITLRLITESKSRVSASNDPNCKDIYRFHLDYNRQSSPI